MSLRQWDLVHTVKSTQPFADKHKWEKKDGTEKE